MLFAAVVRAILRSEPIMSQLRLALFQPDIAPNAGTLMRLCACLGVRLDIIEPCGFVLSDRNFRRAGMDYLDQAPLTRHRDWPEFYNTLNGGRLLALSTKAAMPYTAFDFRNNDVLLLGRESSGLPEDIHTQADARLRVPMQPGFRSLNVAIAGAMVLGEALRQTAGFAESAAKA